MSAGTSPLRESTCSWFEKHRSDPPKQSTPVQLAAPGLKALPATDGAYTSLSPRVREGEPPGSCPGPRRPPVCPSGGQPALSPEVSGQGAPAPPLPAVIFQRGAETAAHPAGARPWLRGQGVKRPP